jgi:hypothetical protein
MRKVKAMTESGAYIEIAERALLAAAGALDKGVQEKAGFLGYHAFESSGSAFCRSRGINVPRNHKQKLSTFTASARKEKFGRQVAQLSIEYGSLRNLLLYPRALQNGTVQRPQDVMTLPQARRLMGRTKTLVSIVKPNV